MKAKKTLYRNQKNIMNQTMNLSDERLVFLGGKRLGDVDIHIEDNACVRKVRRIMEKRISQEYWRNREYSNGNGDRQTMRHHLSNHLKNIYGSVPKGFRYCA